jgi:hypothetical protein
VVHWVGPPAKSIGRCVNSGPFPSDPYPRHPTGSDPDRPTESDQDKAKKKRKRKK